MSVFVTRLCKIQCSTICSHRGPADVRSNACTVCGHNINTPAGRSADDVMSAQYQSVYHESSYAGCITGWASIAGLPINSNSETMVVELHEPGLVVIRSSYRRRDWL